MLQPLLSLPAQTLPIELEDLDRHLAPGASRMDGAVLVVMEVILGMIAGVEKERPLFLKLGAVGPWPGAILLVLDREPAGLEAVARGADQQQVLPLQRQPPVVGVVVTLGAASSPLRTVVVDVPGRRRFDRLLAEGALGVERRR